MVIDAAIDSLSQKVAEVMTEASSEYTELNVLPSIPERRFN